MKKKVVGIFICMLMIGTTTIAVADWAPGDGYKMHFPQMPDPVGWDVNFHDFYLADDWQCSETGPVTDVHFWISWHHDIVAELPYIQVSIYSNNPQGPGGWSQPLSQLWTRTFTPDQFIIAGPWTGDQGWLEPYGSYFLHDHIQYYQINIKDIEQPFDQEEGTIYWLVIQMPYLYPIEMGWKTSKDAFMDAAVWGSPGQWMPIIDPITQQPINFAFVITGKVPVPDLDCDGSLSWTNIHAGDTVSGTFQVGNIGDPGSLLNWQVTSWPDWGTWTFAPPSGTGLAAGAWTTVTATCISPKLPYVLQILQNHQYGGNIVVTNTDNVSDNDTVPVSLITPVNQPSIQGSNQQSQNQLLLRALILHLNANKLLHIYQTTG
jgi:hypothetical protein